MIQEVLVTSQNLDGIPHIAPMGIHLHNGQPIIMPFKPSTTLNNFLETGYAVINYCDDVRIFAGCLTGRREWPLVPAEQIYGYYLKTALAHSECRLDKVIDDDLRPLLFCRVIHTINHRAFQGFNRAQYSVIEAAILVSRLNLLPKEKVCRELDYLRIGFEKTAGENEREAWAWLMEKIETHYAGLES